jgi:CDP-4-dehydro-6-deoxyglucose reductase, E1
MNQDKHKELSENKDGHSDDLNWPLMEDNILTRDLDVVVDYLRQDNPRLTQADQVVAFEKEWSEWLGVKHSVFVNSGSSANLLTLSILKQTAGFGEVIVPTLTWVSDIASVIQCGFEPVFVDIDPVTLGMDIDQVISKITSRTKAVFLTHILGYCALNKKLIDVLEKENIPLIEDVCESHGATFQGRKLGSYGWISNFSFYYAHHMSTIEGGMISTDDDDVYQMARMFRSHGMVREADAPDLRNIYIEQNPELNPEFIFAFPAYNVRSTEINALIGRSQLKHLDRNNEIRRKNLDVFLDHLDREKYYTDFQREGNCNYALTLIIKRPDLDFCEKVMEMLAKLRVEFRRGTSGGGNQLRQPYLKGIVGSREFEKYPNVDHVHFYGFYIGNYPTLNEKKILLLCEKLNQIDI